MLPTLLLTRFETILGSDISSVLEAFSQERKGSFRINTLKTNGNDVFEEFEQKWIHIDLFQGIEGIYMFDRSFEYALKGTRAFYDGKIYLQSISSLIPVLALAPVSGEIILDVCAAPGSKTTQMAAMMQNTGSILAIEQNQIRFDKLMHNIRLQGATNIHGIKLDAKKYLEGDFEITGDEIHKKGKYAKYHGEDYGEVPQFDRILLDAPCSAEGRILLSNEKSYGFWSVENIEKKAELQYELLSWAVKHLKSGGVFVYSTCTLAPEENEGVIARFLREHPDMKLQDIILGLSGRSWWKSGLTTWNGMNYGEDMKKAVRILPSDETEGFFVVKMVKR